LRSIWGYDVVSWVPFFEPPRAASRSLAACTEWVNSMQLEIPCREFRRLRNPRAVEPSIGGQNRIQAPAGHDQTGYHRSMVSSPCNGHIPEFASGPKMWATRQCLNSRVEQQSGPSRKTPGSRSLYQSDRRHDVPKFLDAARHLAHLPRLQPRGADPTDRGLVLGLHATRPPAAMSRRPSVGRGARFHPVQGSCEQMTWTIVRVHPHLPRGSGQSAGFLLNTQWGWATSGSMRVSTPSRDFRIIESTLASFYGPGAQLMRPKLVRPTYRASMDGPGEPLVPNRACGRAVSVTFR